MLQFLDFRHCEINFAGVRNVEVRPAISTTLTITVNCKWQKFFKNLKTAKLQHCPIDSSVSPRYRRSTVSNLLGQCFSHFQQWQLTVRDTVRVRLYGLFIPRTIRTMDYSYYGSTNRTIGYSYLGLFVRWTFYTMDVAYDGLFVRWTIHTKDDSYNGLFVPICKVFSQH